MECTDYNGNLAIDSHTAKIFLQQVFCCNPYQERPEVDGCSRNQHKHIVVNTSLLKYKNGTTEATFYL